MVRPHVPVVVLAALAVAVAFRRRRGRPPVLGPVGRVVTIVVLMAAMAFVLGQRRRPPPAELGGDEHDRGGRRAARPGGVGHGRRWLADRPPDAEHAAGVPGCRDVRALPPDDPRGRTRPATSLAAIETTIVLALCAVSWKRLRNVPAMAFRRPYVLFCVVYTGIFAFAWSSFANLGALARQRVQVWPFVLLLLALPIVVPPSERPATAPAPGRVVARR